MIQIQVGDKVKLNHNSGVFTDISLPERFMGKIVTVISIDYNEYLFKDGNGTWYFTKGLIEKVIQNKITDWKKRII